MARQLFSATDWSGPFPLKVVFFFFCGFNFKFIIIANSVDHEKTLRQILVCTICKWGWSGEAILLGKLSVPGRPTSLDDGRARAYCARSRCGWGFVWTFFLSSICSLFFLPLWETARYRLKYCLKGPLNPKQPTNQLFANSHYVTRFRCAYTVELQWLEH